MKFNLAAVLFGVTVSVNAAALSNCNRDLCFRELLRKKFTKECLSYGSAAQVSTPTFTYSRTVLEYVHVTVTPSVVRVTKTAGETETITQTVSTSTTVITVQPTSAQAKIKRDKIPIPQYVYSVCSTDTDRRFLSACSCIIAELKTGVAMPAVRPRTTTITYKVTNFVTTSLPTPTSTITITPQVTKAITDIKTATQTAQPENATFKIKFRGGVHDGRYLFPGPIFEGQEGIFYSMFTPERKDGLDFKISKDGVITSTTGLNLTWSIDFDDDIEYPGQNEGDPPFKVPSFIFLMSPTAQSNPEYRSYPVKCALVGADNFGCAVGVDNQRTEVGWYAFGIDAVSYIPTLGIGKPGHNWAYWPGQKVGIAAEWSP